jgi:hypothetical protein
MASRKLELWALALAVLPLAIIFAMSLMPWYGQRHLPDSIVYPARAALLTALLLAITSLCLAIRAFRLRGFAPAAAVATLLGGGFIVWAVPYVYDVSCVLLKGGAC